MRAEAPTYTNTRRGDYRGPTEGQRAEAREGGGAEVTWKPSTCFLGFGNDPCCNSWVTPGKCRGGRRGRGQLGPEVVGGLLLWVEANQGCCLDPLTCLGPSVPAGTPREQEGGLGPPEPAPANANTAAHSTGRRNKAEAQETQLAQAPRGPAGSSCHPASTRARSHCLLVPSAPSICAVWVRGQTQQAASWLPSAVP